MTSAGTLMKAVWLLLAFAGIATLLGLTSISWKLSTESNKVMANAYIDTENDPALLRFKSGEQGAERPNVDFFVYSVTNAEDVMTGAKPRMETIGPFQYVQKTEVNGEVKVSDGFTTFSASKKYELRGSADEMEQLLRREVVVPNMFFKDLSMGNLSAAKTEEYGTSAAAPLFIKVSAGQVLGSTAVNWKAEPLLQEKMTFADYGGLGASEQKDVRMKTGQRFKAKGFRYIVEDGVTQYCKFDQDCASETVDSCAAGGTCQPLAAEGFELLASAPAELFEHKGSQHHGVGNNIRQWVGHPVPPVSYTNIQATEIETGDAPNLIMNSSARVYHWVVSDFASRRENCGNAPGHPAGKPGLDCMSPRKSAALAPWASNLPLYVSFHKFSAAESKYDNFLRQFGRSEGVDDVAWATYKKPARTLVGPVAKKSFALKGAYDPAMKVDLSEVPDFEEPASFKSEVHSGEILEMELPLMFSVRIPEKSTLFPEVSDALVPVLTRRTYYKADKAKLAGIADFQFWLRALPIQAAAILYAVATAATVMGLCKFLGEKRIALLFGTLKTTKQARPVVVAAQ